MLPLKYIENFVLIGSAIAGIYSALRAVLALAAFLINLKVAIKDNNGHIERIEKQLEEEKQNRLKDTAEFKQQLNAILSEMHNIGDTVNLVNHDVKGMRTTQGSFLKFAEKVEGRLEKAEDRMHAIELKVS